MALISPCCERLNAAGIIVLTLSHTEPHPISPLLANQTGDPGTGKTSLMGRVSRRYERLNAAGFIVLTHFAGVGTFYPHTKFQILNPRSPELQKKRIPNSASTAVRVPQCSGLHRPLSLALTRASARNPTTQKEMLHTLSLKRIRCT